MASDVWTRDTPFTSEQLKAFRAKMVEHCNELGRAPEKFTCDDCARASKCKLAFDGYNTDGDCLYSK